MKTLTLVAIALLIPVISACSGDPTGVSGFGPECIGSMGCPGTKPWASDGQLPPPAAWGSGAGQQPTQP